MAFSNFLFLHWFLLPLTSTMNSTSKINFKVHSTFIHQITFHATQLMIKCPVLRLMTGWSLYLASQLISQVTTWDGASRTYELHHYMGGGWPLFFIKLKVWKEKDLSMEETPQKSFSVSKCWGLEFGDTLFTKHSNVMMPVAAIAVAFC